jgi:glycosyltransferase involved in cell wall biosynthesis
MPRVSVIIPVHNRVQAVGEAIDSVLGQTYRDFEVIVVDDASTDDTASALTHHRAPVRVVRRERSSGAGAARNDGIRASTGEFIAFLDSDDLYSPRRLESAVDLLDAHREYGAVYADAVELAPTPGLPASRWVAARGGGRSGWILDSILAHDLVRTPTITARRAVLDRVGLFDEDLPVGEDSDLWWRIAVQTQMGYTDEIVATVRVSADSISRKGSTVSQGWVRRSQKALRSLRVTARERRLLQARLYEDLRNHASDLDEEGHAWQARSACLLAARTALAAGFWGSAFKSVAAATCGHEGARWIRRLAGSDRPASGQGGSDRSLQAR